jgi:hypothetical protein
MGADGDASALTGAYLYLTTASNGQVRSTIPIVQYRCFDSMASRLLKTAVGIVLATHSANAQLASEFGPYYKMRRTLRCPTIVVGKASLKGP